MISNDDVNGSAEPRGRAEKQITPKLYTVALHRNTVQSLVILNFIFLRKTPEIPKALGRAWPGLHPQSLGAGYL